MSVQESRQPAASKDDWERALLGLDFPIARDALIRHAETHGGVDHEVFEMMSRLRHDEYESEDDLVAEIRELYLDSGLSASALPL